MGGRKGRGGKEEMRKRGKEGGNEGRGGEEEMRKRGKEGGMKVGKEGSRVEIITLISS